ncbi:MAG TPA: type VI secretion system-associated FHA domain protein TagH [Paraburkholderia sp.]|nr:type VI secretion system-associated FHA domain protein TagH [Paraburkholderia sp.]
MYLTLTVGTYQGSAPDTPLACRFGAAGGTIGRGPDNTMVLPDAAKTVSRVHARIDWTEDGWRLADLGSNPSRHNGRPLASDQPARLADGDLLEMGGYRLDVRTIAPAPADAFDAPLGVHDGCRFHPLDIATPGERALVQACAHDALARAAVLADSPLTEPRLDPLAAPLGDAHEALVRLDGHAVFAGSGSDHVPPEQFAYVPPAGAMAHVRAGCIPHDYDPLDDAAFTRSESTAAPPMREPVRRIPAAQTDAAANHANAESSFAALLDGLDLDPGALGGRNTAEVARLVGVMLRTSVRGVVDVLLSRSVLKRAISLDTTMLVQRDNNPLKFFPDGDGALAQMLRGASAGYLPAQTALEGAFDDIRRHELAVLAGTRAAMQHLLGRFDPQAVARADTRRGWLDWLPACRKARQWDHLVALHAELTRAGADDLQALCGSAFNDAYERHANGCADAMPMVPSIR